MTTSCDVLSLIGSGRSGAGGAKSRLGSNGTAFALLAAGASCGPLLFVGGIPLRRTKAKGELRSTREHGQRQPLNVRRAHGGGGAFRRATATPVCRGWRNFAWRGGVGVGGTGRRLWIGLKRPSASLKQRVQTLLGPLGLMANSIYSGGAQVLRPGGRLYLPPNHLRRLPAPSAARPRTRTSAARRTPPAANG